MPRKSRDIRVAFVNRIAFVKILKTFALCFSQSQLQYKYTTLLLLPLTCSVDSWLNESTAKVIATRGEVSGASDNEFHVRIYR
jgi:hypothetical protein